MSSGKTDPEQLRGKRELARIALLEAAGGPRRAVHDLCAALDLNASDFARYWDGHSAIPDALALRLAEHLERRAETVLSLVSTLRAYLNDSAAEEER